MALATIIDRLALCLPSSVKRRMPNPFTLSAWNFTAGGHAVEAMIPDEWIHQIRSDDGSGKLTGFDRDGRYERAFCDVFVSKVSAESVLLDVGANFGIYSVIAAQLCDPQRIHAFEPDRNALGVLRVNNERYCNNALNVVPLAAGARDQNGTITLDTYCDRHGVTPTIVKLDIEGAEIDALAGMREICARYRPTILFELHLRKLRNFWHRDPSLVLAMLSDYGYRTRFNGHHGHLATNRGEPDTAWHDDLPNDVNCAVLAEPL